MAPLEVREPGSSARAGRRSIGAGRSGQSASLEAATHPARAGSFNHPFQPPVFVHQATRKQTSRGAAKGRKQPRAVGTNRQISTTRDVGRLPSAVEQRRDRRQFPEGRELGRPAIAAGALPWPGRGALPRPRRGPWRSLSAARQAATAGLLALKGISVLFPYPAIRGRGRPAPVTIQGGQTPGITGCHVAFSPR